MSHGETHAQLRPAARHDREEGHRHEVAGFDQPIAEGDRVQLYVFGVDPLEAGITRVLLRELTPSIGEMLIDVDAETLDLAVPDVMPLEGRFGEGDIAFAACVEHTSGQLKPAFHADFVVLDADEHLLSSPQRFSCVEIAQVWSGGKRRC